MRMEQRLYSLVNVLDALKGQLSTLCFDDTWLLRSILEDDEEESEQQEHGA